MAEPVTINAQPPINKGLDYSYLKEQGISIIQLLSGNIWTDYNEHDPGVTALEQLCYALTELSYRAELPIEDILTEKNSGEINARQQALYLPEIILPCNPLTVNDYRKLIVDRILQVANVWLYAYPPDKSQGVKGLYCMYLYVPDIDECICDNDDSHHPDKIIQEVTLLYNKHRDLCEDLQQVCILKSVLTRIEAKVSISDNALASSVMAQLLFQLDLLLAPRIQRSSLSRWLDDGISTDKIFNGPLLLNGLIADDQLQDKASCIPVPDIVRTMIEVNGVTSVADVKACLVDSGKCFSGSENIPVLIDEILKLDLQEGNNGQEFSITLYRNGSEVSVNRTLVLFELRKLLLEYQRRYDLKVEYQEYFAFPAGVYRNLAEYYSVQNQFPALYGINAAGVASSESASRHGQGKQLKGYLLVYDQLLANFFAQLAHVKDLYSIKEDLPYSYFYQYLDSSVPNVEPILNNSTGPDNYYEGLPEIVHASDPTNNRRNRFLNFLLAIYGQVLNDIGTIPGQNPISGLQSNIDNDIQAKLDWLQHLVEGTARRGQAMDYLGRFTKHNIAGMQIKIRIELGMPPFCYQPLNQLCAQFSVTLVENNEQATLGLLNGSLASGPEEGFSNLSAIELVTETGERDGQKTADNLLHGQRISDGFIEAGAHQDNYRIASHHHEGTVNLMCKSTDAGNQWYFIGQYANGSYAVEVAMKFLQQIRKLHHCCQQLYFVEHLLLRYALEDSSSDNESCSQLFEYSFTLSAVVGISYSQRGSESYRNNVREVVRRNSPAHLWVNYCFLTPFAMLYFEYLYWRWRLALKSGDSEQRRHSSIQLRDYLQNHCNNRGQES